MRRREKEREGGTCNVGDKNNLGEESCGEGERKAGDGRGKVIRGVI